MLEKEIEKILTDGARRLGGRAYKWVSPGSAGVPDRIVILPGRAPVFVELKTDRGSLTGLQKLQIRRLQELGQDVRVLRGEDAVKEFLEEVTGNGIPAACLSAALHQKDHRDQKTGTVPGHGSGENSHYTDSHKGAEI